MKLKSLNQFIILTYLLIYIIILNNNYSYANNQNETNIIIERLNKIILVKKLGYVPDDETEVYENAKKNNDKLVIEKLNEAIATKPDFTIATKSILARRIATSQIESDIILVRRHDITVLFDEIFKILKKDKKLLTNDEHKVILEKSFVDYKNLYIEGK